MKFLSLLLCLFALSAQATVTPSSAITAGVGTGSTTVTCGLTSVPANGTIVLGILNRTDETATISSISDTVNGSWTLNYVSGPVDSTNGTFRSWLAYFNGVASGSPTVTVTFSGAINSQLACAFMSSDLGAMTYDAAATPLHTAIGATANVDSNTVSATGAGAAIGFISMNNSQADPEPSADGAGESRLTSGQAGARAFLFYEAYASAGSYGFESTTDATVATWLVGAFLEPSSSSGLLLRRRRN